jgi:hypothetical protein
MSKKMSYVSAIDAILSGAPCEGEVRERLEALRASQAKRSASKSGKPTKAQVEAMAVAEKVAEAMTAGEVYEWKAIADLLPDGEKRTAQRVTALMKRLIEAGRVSKAEVKGKMTYTLVTGDETTGE